MSPDGGPTPRERVAELLRVAQDMDHGPDQVGVCEQAVDLADEHNDLDAGFVARRRLIQASTFSGMPDKSMVAFAWCLAQCDRDPTRFPEQRVLWQYKWVVMSLYGFPEIPRHKIEDATNDIEERYIRQGLSLRPIWRIRLISARGMGDHDQVPGYLDRWLDAPRDRFTDCRACETSTHLGYLVDQGKDEEALAVAQPLLDGRLKCATQPEITYGRLLLPFVRLGNPVRAAGLHLDGYRRIKAQPHYYTTTIAQHLSFLALTRNYGRAIAVLERHLSLGLEDPTPNDRFFFFLACSFLIERMKADGEKTVQARLARSFPAWKEDGHYTTAGLHDWFETELRSLADRFDRRNGNDHFTRSIERSRALAEHQLHHPL